MPMLPDFARDLPHPMRVHCPALHTNLEVMAQYQRQPGQRLGALSLRPRHDRVQAPSRDAASFVIHGPDRCGSGHRHDPPRSSPGGMLWTRFVCARNSSPPS
jgi:hypothetical protein